MSLLFSKKFIWALILIVTVLITIISSNFFLKSKTSLNREVTTVSRGDVTSIVTVSGKIEAKQIVNLTFPTTGTIQNVYKNEGDHVTKGEILASITQESALGEYNAAIQNLAFIKLTKEELIRGPVESNRFVSEKKLLIAETNVLRTNKEQDVIVKNALQKLLSEGLEAVPVSNTNNDIAPQISGSYICADEAEYIVSIFGSKSSTGYSYRLSGSEEGTFTAYTDAPAPLGSCGLYIKFDGTEMYRTQDWTISIPNKRSDFYITNKNNYDLALQQQANAISASKQALELAVKTRDETNATPSSEAIGKANANIREAEARLAIAEAKIEDHTIRAPFDGIISDQNIKVGETANLDRNITLLKEGLYDIKARIPEVDIVNIEVGNTVVVSFDAKPLDLLTGKITQISANSTEVDGVAYYEATLELSENPNWMRTGLNADIEIIIQQKTDVLRVPESFILSDENYKYVLTRDPETNNIVRTPIEIGLVGNNGYAEVFNLSEDSEIILP